MVPKPIECNKRRKSPSTLFKKGKRNNHEIIKEIFSINSWRGYRKGWIQILCILIMSKISGHRHVLTLRDGTYVDGRVYLQKRDIVKKCTGSGPAGEPPMLKSDVCYLNSNFNDKSVEVRKESVPWFEKLSALYRRLLAPCRLYAFNGFYTLICNRLVIDLGSLIVFFDFYADV